MTAYTIQDSTGTSATILPEKGATVVSLKKGETEFLYRDDENLCSDERPRCGIPFLFPVFGRLKDGKYSWNGKSYAMGIHGFSHTSIWKVTGHTADRLEVVLAEDETTLCQYPFPFRVTLTFSMADSTLTIYQKYENPGISPLPYNYGFHPYFLTEKPENLQVEATADLRLDFVTGQTPFGHGTLQIAVPEGAPEAGGCLLGVHGPTVLRNPIAATTLTMDFDGSFHTHVLWTQAGKHFLCVEPVNGSADSLNAGTYMTLSPGETKEAFVSFRVDTN